MVGPHRVAPEPGRRPAAGRPAARRRRGEPRFGSARRGGSRLLADACWIGILLAAGSFQIGRGAPVEGVPFVLAALVLVADELGMLARADVALAPPRALHWAVVAVVAASAIAVGITPEFGWPTVVLVTAAGLAAVAPAWSAREPFDPLDPRGAGAPDAPGVPFADPAVPAANPMSAAVRRAAIGWAAVAIALCLWELASFFAGLSSASADWEHPALSDLVRPAVALPPVRALLFAAWLAVGRAFARRGWAGREAESGGSAYPDPGADPGTDPGTGPGTDPGPELSGGRLG